MCNACVLIIYSSYYHTLVYTFLYEKMLPCLPSLFHSRPYPYICFFGELNTNGECKWYLIFIQDPLNVSQLKIWICNTIFRIENFQTAGITHILIVAYFPKFFSQYSSRSFQYLFTGTRSLFARKYLEIKSLLDS